MISANTKWLSSAFLVLSLLVTGCGKESSKSLATNSITVGVSAGTHEEILNVVKTLAKKEGFEITIKAFGEGNPINAALADGQLDVNIFQTLPFLEEQMSQHANYRFSTVFATIAEPMAIYSTKIKDIKDLKRGDKVAVPNDPANELRALRLFEHAGLIKLKADIGEQGTIRDIVENPKELKFVSLAGAQLPLQLPDLTAAAINGSFALQHNITPAEHGLIQEPREILYPNYVVVRSENKQDAAIGKLKAFYHQDAVRQFIAQRYKGAVIPTFHD